MCNNCKIILVQIQNSNSHCVKSFEADFMYAGGSVVWFEICCLWPCTQLPEARHQTKLNSQVCVSVCVCVCVCERERERQRQEDSWRALLSIQTGLHFTKWSNDQSKACGQLKATLTWTTGLLYNHDFTDKDCISVFNAISSHLSSNSMEKEWVWLWSTQGKVLSLTGISTIIPHGLMRQRS